MRTILNNLVHYISSKMTRTRVKLAYMLIYNINLVKIFNILHIINKKKKLRDQNFRKNLKFRKFIS